MKSLFTISNEAIELASFLEEGELSPEMELALVINQNELQEKSINYGYVIRTFDHDITAIDTEIKRLQALKTAKNNAIDRMKESVLQAMNIYGIEKIESPTLKLSIRSSKSVDIGLEEMIPSEFKKERTTISIDKVAIKKAIDSGESVPGATIKENQNLQIK
jgi:hypothetical protein